MLEVACAVCGAVYRFPEADVPVGGKTVTCAKCKARLVVQAPPPPPLMVGGTGDVIDLGGPDPISMPDEVVDLPAPRVARPEPPPDIVDLPAPRVVARPELPPEVVDLPAPRVAARPELPPEVVDLPAPKLPPRERLPEPLTLDNIDLLAPVRPPAPATAAAPPVVPPVAPAPTARPLPASLPDLPAPKRASDPARPAPVVPPFPVPSGPAPAAAPPPTPAAARADVPDLPAPKYGGPARDLFDDLPSARGPSLADLPIPKRPSGPAPNQPGVTDLPAPKGFFDDLPRPAPAAAQVDRSAPDLPAPKGFFDDLPQPHTGPGRTDLPAPKGFFDDLPQPQTAAGAARPDLPAPKGFFDDLPQPQTAAGAARTDLPAPKGFFDDLPQPQTAAGAARTDLPAPKGFFDDLPQVAQPGRSDVPAPKGFFDDLPQPGYAASGVDLPVPQDLFDDQARAQRADTYERALAEPRTSTRGGADAPPLDLGDDHLSGLDLPDAPPMIPATRTGVVSFKPGETGATPTTRTGTGPAGELDLAAPSRRDSGAIPPSPRSEPGPRRPRRNLARIVLAAALGVAVAGAGGYYAYDRWQSKKALAAATERDLAAANKALLAGRWGPALTAAKQVLTRSPQHGEALAAASLAQLAGYLDQGTNREGRVKGGRGLLEQARLASASGPIMEEAAALDVLLEGDSKAAIDRLAPIADREPSALLFLGWAHLAAEHWDDAAAAFERALKATPGRKLPATYGRGRALLGKGDLEGARTEFLAVIALDPEHVGAQVGLAAATPASDFLAREKELLAILARPTIDTADPRARALAWKLAGNDARTAGRLDTARERYRKALALAPSDVGALVAAAGLEVRDHKYEVAASGVAEALTLAPDDVEANLVKIELDLATDHVDDATARLDTLRKRQPPVSSVAHRGRIELLDGDRLARRGDSAGALTAYAKAREILGKGDVGPSIAIATLLGKQAKAAADAGKADEAATLRARATAELAELASAATTDPGLAVTLGVAYLDAGGLTEAERWLRSAIAARPDDLEARFQLAEVLRRAGNEGEALATMQAAFDVAPTRTDLGVALARAYEGARRDTDAATVYDRLLADEKKPDLADKIPLEVRIRAGRFFARTGKKVRAGEQGAAVLAVEADNPAGLFLRGEGLLAAIKAPKDSKLLLARQAFKAACDKDPDPQFLDGLGRALERIFDEDNNTSARDEALAAYQRATAGDVKANQKATMLNPLAAAGRLHMHRQEYEQAIEKLEEANKLSPSAVYAGGIGRAYAALHDRAQAIAWLERASAGDADAETLFVLGGLYIETNRLDAAIRALDGATRQAQAAVDGGTARPGWLTNAFYTLGDLQERRGNYRAACLAYRSYLAGGPTDEAKAKAVRNTQMPGVCD